MPTGYTADVTDETTLAEFAMKCARALGALVTMREDPADAPIPEKFEPSDYHIEELKKAEGKLAELRSMTLEQATVLCAADHKAAMVEWKKRRAEDLALRERYERLRGLVRKWKAPTADHEGFKEFMDEQLASSIKFDCHDSGEPKPQAPRDWLEAKIKNAEWSVSYHREEGAKEVDRARTRSEWVKRLRESLA
jgi:hypothetical protein